MTGRARASSAKRKTGRKKPSPNGASAPPAETPEAHPPAPSGESRQVQLNRETEEFGALDSAVKNAEENLERLRAAREQKRGRIAVLQELVAAK